MRDLAGGPVVKSLLCNPENLGSIRSQELFLGAKGQLSPCGSTAEPMRSRAPCAAMKKPVCSNEDPVQRQKEKRNMGEIDISSKKRGDGYQAMKNTQRY